MDKAGGTCSQCNKPVEKPRACSRCRMTSYCNETCQKEHWPAHKEGCIPPPGWYLIRRSTAPDGKDKVTFGSSNLIYIFSKCSPPKILIERGQQYMLTGDRAFDWTGPHPVNHYRRDTDRPAISLPRFVLESTSIATLHTPMKRIKHPSDPCTGIPDANLHTPTQQELTIISHVPTDGSWRTMKDQSVHFGDGGECHYVWPMYQKNGVLSEPSRLALLEALKKLAQGRGDIQGKGSAVEDIIDPNLCPRKISNPDWGKRTWEELMVDWKLRNPKTTYMPIEESEYRDVRIHPLLLHESPPFRPHLEICCNRVHEVIEVSSHCPSADLLFVASKLLIGFV